MFALFDEHEAILMPTPGFELLSHAIEMRSSIRCVFADTEHLKDQFASASIPELLAAFEDAINGALAQGLTVRAIFLCNPHNPLGRCYEPSVLRAIMAFCETRGLHLVVDEIYALSASEGRFHSTLTVSGTAATNVHVLYGPGKDWGLCGARLGCLITRNHELLRTLEQTARFTRASSLAEELLLSIFSDHEYTDSVHIPALRKRLSLARACVMQRLTELEIPFVEPHASFGIWIDLQRYLRFFCQNSSASREAQLARYLLSRGVLLMPSDVSSSQRHWFQSINPGLTMVEAFHTNDRGAFRLNYAVDAEMLRNGMDRFERALGELKVTHRPRAKRLSK
ncbi:predicted protein [Aspergillus terreus NIH2624]|uniref:Aminotransferase class I/classII large domain-containing protein n=1 Tax=Aspergillus terreus (strain NIH 2624 / FGSC A1156) TaxID=341663 RepID=Q0CU01_ASPTN|nr:uncharacterized protein ATEG_02833 [Aspergillus terreus NIH2624]EAU36107.1 predicted protein [Aspergillus terreus NIH2624]